MKKIYYMLILQIKINSEKPNFYQEFYTDGFYLEKKVLIKGQTYVIPKRDKSIIFTEKGNALTGIIYNIKSNLTYNYIEHPSQIEKEKIIESNDKQTIFKPIKFMLFLDKNYIAIERIHSMDNERAVIFFNTLLETKHGGKIYTVYQTETPINDLSAFSSTKFEYNVKRANPIKGDAIMRIDELMEATNSMQAVGSLLSGRERGLTISGNKLIESIIELSKAGYGNVKIEYTDKDGNEKKYDQKKDVLVLKSPPIEKDDDQALIDWLIDKI